MEAEGKEDTVAPNGANGATRTKTFSIFDCDAHIDDPHVIFTKYVEPKYREVVRLNYVREEDHVLLNGHVETVGGGTPREQPNMSFNGARISGPGMNDKRLKRRLLKMTLSPEQTAYLNHNGAEFPEARLKDMDLMGIDQVLIIPTMIVTHLPYSDNAEGAYGMARAYNNWLEDYCKAGPDRLFGAGILPSTDAAYSTKEVERSARRGFRVVLIRPVGHRGRYPNEIYYYPNAGTRTTYTMDNVFRAIEESGMTLGMHTFPSLHEYEEQMTSSSELIPRSGAGTDRVTSHETFGFIFEAMTWLSQVLLSGFLDRYPRLKMAIFESNASWLPQFLERCDLLFRLYKNERIQPAKRLPSEAFYDQCLIAFEGDEKEAFRQWKRYENIGIWSSDAYHRDGTDAWLALRTMEEAEVPAEVQAKLMGANARRAYGIEEKLFVTRESEGLPRPAWFPTPEEIDRWWKEEESNPKHVPVKQRGRAGIPVSRGVRR